MLSFSRISRICSTMSCSRAFRTAKSRRVECSRSTRFGSSARRNIPSSTFSIRAWTSFCVKFKFAVFYARFQLNNLIELVEHIYKTVPLGHLFQDRFHPGDDLLLPVDGRLQLGRVGGIAGGRRQGVEGGGLRTDQLLLQGFERRQH